MVYGEFPYGNFVEVTAMERQNNRSKSKDRSTQEQCLYEPFRDWFQVDGDLDDFIFYFENEAESGD